MFVCVFVGCTCCDSCMSLRMACVRIRVYVHTNTRTQLYKAELSKMQSALGDSQQEIALLAKESALAKAQKEHVEILVAKARDLEEATTEVATLKHQLQMVQSELLVSQQDLKASLEALKEKERESVTAAEQVVKLKELAEQVVKLKTELEDMTNSRDEALKEKEKGRVTAEKGRVTFAEQVVKLKKELVDMKNSLRGELDSALGKLEKETDRIADLNLKNTDLHNELDALKSKVEALDASKAKLMSGLELSQQVSHAHIHTTHTHTHTRTHTHIVI